MTKYVVNSGNVRADKEKAKKFVAEVVANLGRTPKILFCTFAVLRQHWEKKFEDYSGDLANYLSETVVPEYKMALPELFVEQCVWADVVWVLGGDDYLLMFWLKQFELTKLWDGKTVATSSASSDAVSAYFWTCDWRKCIDGLGLISIKFLPHFGSSYGNDDPRGTIDWVAAKTELAEYGDESLTIYALPEGDFAVFEI